MPSEWFNPCGVPYRLWEDGRVELEGQGFPAFDPGGQVAAKIASIWEKWKAPIVSAASKFSMPPAWLVGIIYIESGGNPTASAPCEPVYCPGIWKSGGCASQGGSETHCAGGLMAFTSGTAKIFGKTIGYYMEHPDEMIHDAAQLIAVGGPAGNVYKGGVKARGGDVLSVAKMYNGGSVCGGGGLTGHGGQGDYVSKFLKVCNTFVALGLGPSASASVAGAGGNLAVMVACVFAGYMLATRTMQGRQFVRYMRRAMSR
jgi:hypothetical protein